MSSQAAEPLTLPPLTFNQDAAESLAPPLSPGQLAWRRFKRHRMALAGSVGLILMIVGILGLIISLYYTSLATRRTREVPADRPVARERDIY